MRSGRQAELLDRGETLRQETRGWNDDSGESYLMRTKEQAHDYRYFPDPDLMPVTFTDAEIEAIRAELPSCPPRCANGSSATTASRNTTPES